VKSRVIEKQVEKKFVAVNFEPVLIADGGEAGTKFEQEVF
jgi:hypothetical protein